MSNQSVDSGFQNPRACFIAQSDPHFDPPEGYLVNPDVGGIAVAVASVSVLSLSQLYLTEPTDIVINVVLREYDLGNIGIQIYTFFRQPFSFDGTITKPRRPSSSSFPKSTPFSSPPLRALAPPTLPFLTHTSPWPLPHRRYRSISSIRPSAASSPETPRVKT